MTTTFPDPPNSPDSSDSAESTDHTTSNGHRPSFGRRFALFLALVVALALVGEVVTRQFVDPVRTIPKPYNRVDPNVQSHVDRMVELSNSTDADQGPIDIVMSGTSIVGVGLDPTVIDAATGATSYNAAIGCANLEIQSEWLPNWVADLAKPDAVVIGLNVGDLDETSCVRDWDDRETYDDTSFDFDWEMYNRSSLWRQREFLAEPQNWRVFWDKEEIVGFWDINIRDTDGFWEVERFKDIDQQTFLLNPDKTFLTKHEATLESLTTAVEGLTEQGIEVVVLEFPMPQRFYDNLTGSEGVSFAEASEAIRGTAEAAGATYLVNDSEEFRDNILFIDESHLTPEGAARFSEWAGEEFATLGLGSSS